MEEKMTWFCVDCNAKFQGPKDRPPVNGCAKCNSPRVIDCNVEWIAPVIVLSEEQIKTNWAAIKQDPHNNRPDIETAKEYIEEARRGKVMACGALVMIKEQFK